MVKITKFNSRKRIIWIILYEKHIKKEEYTNIMQQKSLRYISVSEALWKNGSYLLSHLSSTIGVTGLNFSVRNGKRWNPRAIATWISLKWQLTHQKVIFSKPERIYHIKKESKRAISNARLNVSPHVHLHPINVVVYDDPEKSNLVAGFALRCFQRLSDPDVDTRRCTWRHNR